jgi:hypothetical protein
MAKDKYTLFEGDINAAQVELIEASEGSKGAGGVAGNILGILSRVPRTIFACRPEPLIGNGMDFDEALAA